MSERGVAVIGLGGVFPGSADVDAFAMSIEQGRSAIADLPASRLEPVFVDPASEAVDRLPGRRGGFLGERFRFDALGHGVMPVAALGAEPDQLVALEVAARAFGDAGLTDRDFDRSRAAVVLGRGGYLTPGLIRLNQVIREAEQIVSVLRDVLPGVSEAELAEVKRRFQEKAGPFRPDTAIGLVPNLTASRIANRLDLQGPAYTIDAACASSLVAVEHGVREIREGRCDLALVGGVHLVHDAGFWAVFANLGALSPSGTIRPFDRRADGLVIGEGCGILVLKALSRALADGDRIHAVIEGVGSSSDGRAASVMVPRPAGQVLALRRAWADAGLDPARAALLEAHGTATPAGDAAELRSAREVFGDGPLAIGSVKSMIGHAMPAAGAAGLIKAVLAVSRGFVPPSVGCEEPHPELPARWRVPASAEPWEGERLAGVSAFGFGGVNAHVVVRAHEGPARRLPRRASRRADAEVVALAAPSLDGLLAALDAGDRRGGSGPVRLAFADPTPERRARAREIAARGAPWMGRKGFWFAPGFEAGSIAFLFPGIEARFEPQVEALCARFGVPVPEYTRPSSLEETGRGVVALGRTLSGILAQIGLGPDHVAGHSIGEWTAMIASGAIPERAVDAFLARVPVGRLEVPGVLFAAAGCGVEVAREVIEDLPDIAVSHDNCPRQVLLCGAEAPIGVARDRLVARGVLCQVLPFRSGFHSPLFRDWLGPHVENLASIALQPAEIPLWSATLADRFPSDPDAMRALAVEHLTAPLRWRELLLRLHAEGVRTFVQVGTGSLPGFVRDTLGDRPHLAVSALEPREDGLASLTELALALWVTGRPGPLDALHPHRPTVDLPLGSPLIRLEGIELARSTALPDAPEPVRQALGRALDALRAGPVEVVAALNARHRVADRVPLSVAAVPALWDHTFFPQPAGWKVASDRHPVVPMTMTLELLVEIAARLEPGRVAVEIDEVEALRWLIVEPALEVERRARREGAWVRAELVGYASARIRFEASYPTDTPRLPPLPSPRPAPIPASELYADRWMFHGPAYQGVVELGPLDPTGIDGVIEVPSGPGALLDNAGQILGYWLMASAEADHLAMPVGMRSVRFFGPAPAVGVRADCRVRIGELGPRVLVGDVELSVDGALWCRIERWADHRFQTDPSVWAVMRRPERVLLSADHGRFRLWDDAAHRAPSRDWLMRRYLDEAERAELAASRSPRSYLNDRIAAKDAARALRWAEGEGPLYPIEAFAPGIEVAVDHAGSVSVAVASRGPVSIAVDPDPAAARARAVAPFAGVEVEAEIAAVGELTVVVARPR